MDQTEQAQALQEGQEERGHEKTLPPMQDWDVYSRVEVVRALQVEETLRIQNQLGVQMANPGDYLVAGASGVIRVVAQQLFQKVYQKEHPVYSPPKSPSGLIVSR